MAPPYTSDSTARSLPATLQELSGPKSATLRRWLEEVFADFYDSLFDASFGDPPEGQPEGGSDRLEVLRTVRAQQPAIVDGACGDITLVLADSGSGVVVPISAGIDATHSRLWKRRLHDAFMRRCTRLQIGPAERKLLEAAFNFRVIGQLEQISGGDPADDVRSTAATGRPADAVEREPADAELERVERLMSRFRAGGLKLPVGEQHGAPSGEPADTLSTPAPEATPESARASGQRSGSRRLVAAFMALLVLMAMALVAWNQRSGLRIQVEPSLRAIGLLPRSAEPVLATTRVESTPPVSPPDKPASGLSVPDARPVEPPPSATARATVARDEGAVAAPLAVASPESVRSSATQPPTTAASDERLPLQVEYLQRRAESALAELRLTEPFVDSAAGNYFAVLAIDPENTAARQGLKRIVERYAELIRAALARGDTGQAALLLQRARSVLPHAPQLQEFEAEH